MDLHDEAQVSKIVLLKPREKPPIVHGKANSRREDPPKREIEGTADRRQQGSMVLRAGFLPYGVTTLFFNAEPPDRRLARFAAAFWRAASVIWILFTTWAPQACAMRVAVPLC